MQSTTQCETPIGRPLLADPPPHISPHDLTLDCQELLEGCLRLRGPANAIDVATLQWLWQQFFLGILHEFPLVKFV